jgi:hypothetical protein
MQKVSLKIALVAAALTLGLGGMAAAHHSGAAYDKEHPRTMEGTVKTVNWSNPISPLSSTPTPRIVNPPPPGSSKSQARAS